MNPFHLSFPVRDFEETRTFYCDLLGGVQEKTNPSWFNVNLLGHQLTFHIMPDAVIGDKNLHWGLVIDWADFHELYDRLKEAGASFSKEPDHQDIGKEQERVKMVFTDPSGYLIEYKAYKNVLAGF